MAVSGNCENGPLSPMGWATGPLWPPVAQATGDRDLSVIFYFSNFFFKQVPGGGRGAGGRSPPPNGRQGRGGLSSPTGDRAELPYLNPPPLSPLILFSKIHKKESGEALLKCASVICRY